MVIHDYEYELSNFEVKLAESIECNQTDKLEGEQVQNEDTVGLSPVGFVPHAEENLHGIDSV